MSSAYGRFGPMISVRMRVLEGEAFWCRRIEGCPLAPKSER